ncbi:hypothetical protein [Microbacterium sp. NPDC090003]|uniref:hypothetical protein n=1 Tax=Microbacterium sp. NPDC090003 TaxID=3364203 RepID=UPI00383045D4
MSGQERSRARGAGRRRMLAGVLGLSMLAVGGTVATVQPTEARFTDTEFVASGTFTAFTVPVPAITGCTVSSVLGTFTGFTITWTSPYLLAQQRFTINDVVVPNSNVTQSGTGPYTYTSTISSSLLGTLLTGGLLGASNTIRVQALLSGTTWTSAAATRTLSVGGLLGLGGNNTCT